MQLLMKRTQSGVVSSSNNKDLSFNDVEISMKKENKSPVMDVRKSDGYNMLKSKKQSIIE